MSKIAVIADTHLIHAYHPEYDKTREFAKLVEDISSHNPVAILVLGDFFDKKPTNQGHPISHVEGAKHQLPVTDIIESTNIPWYSLLGNHEDESVLKLIARTVSNFNFRLTDPKEGLKANAPDIAKPEVLDGVRFWFGDVHEKESHRTKETKLKEYCTAAAKVSRDKNVLLLHLDLIRRGEDVGISKELVELLSKNFDLVLNGHEHAFSSKVDGFSNVILAPASLPTWVGLREGLIEKYEFSSKGLEKSSTKVREPRGYLLLDSDTLTLDFVPFHSSMPAVSVSYDVTEKDLIAIGNDWRKIAANLQQELIGTRNIESLVVIPVLTGTLGFLLPFEINSLLEEVSNEIPDIHLVNIRTQELKTPGLDIETPDEAEILNLDGVFAKTLEQAKIVSKKLREKGIELTASHVKKLVEKMRKEDRNFFFEKGSKTVKVYTAELINTLLPEFNEILNTEWKSADVIHIVTESFEKEGN